MNRAKWIWYYNDYAIYHSMLLHCRRQELGCDYPCVWYVPRPELNATFQKKNVVIEQDTVLRCVTHGKGKMHINHVPYPVNKDIPLSKGTYDFYINIYDLDLFPAIFIDNEFVSTDESWEAYSIQDEWLPVGCEPAYTEANADLSVFPFCYEEQSAIAAEPLNGGVLYDYGKETFAVVRLKSNRNLNGLRIVYGESKEEALDEKNAIVRDTVEEDRTEITFPPRAFRYLAVYANEQPVIQVQYEYLPLTDKASFHCNDPLVKDIWDKCAYTFHLNSREFFLDGIKRDRWVWSGDAYQSFLINRYLYEDDAITKRTLLALLGKPPYREHINTINDYSAYLILAVCEYIEQSGDLRFLRQVIDSVKALYQFICSRLSDEGYVVKRKGDWIFMDWHSFDKTDPFCPEQILLWKVHTAMAKLNQSLGESAEDCIRRAEKLKEKIEKDFWCEEKQAYIDSFASGQKKVTRHAAVFAILFDFVDTEKAQLLGKSVLENETVAPITTPYFKLYELMALCRLGKIEPMQQYLTEYWGGMLSLGATSIWEAYDPTQSGEQHLSMYGKPFDRSLCHAWGSGPIYLLGRYCCGVEKNCNDFTVTPNHGIYTEFCAAVPVNGKTVTVEYKNGTYHIVTDAENGSVIQNGKAVPLIPNQPLEWTDSEKQ